MKHTFLALTIGFTLLARTVGATPIGYEADGQIDFRGVGKSSVVSIHSPTLGNVMVYAGELKWMWIGAAPDGFEQYFFSYCVDANEYLHDPQWVNITDSDNVNSSISEAGEKVAWLFNQFAGTINESGTGAQAAGLQLAIWEVLYDNPIFDVGGDLLPATMLAGGNFWASASTQVLGFATGYLGDLFSNDYDGAMATMLAAPDGWGQDQLVAAPVPEPGSLILCGSGIIAAIVSVRRRRRKANGAQAPVVSI